MTETTPTQPTSANPQPAARTIHLPTACHHIFPDGHRCGSPALRRQDHCFFHDPSRVLSPRSPLPGSLPKRSRAERYQPLIIPPPVNRASILAGLELVARALAADTIAPRRAGRLIYCLQLAGRNLGVPS